MATFSRANFGPQNASISILASSAQLSSWVDGWLTGSPGNFGLYDILNDANLEDIENNFSLGILAASPAPSFNLATVIASYLTGLVLCCHTSFRSEAEDFDNALANRMWYHMKLFDYLLWYWGLNVEVLQSNATRYTWGQGVSPAVAVQFNGAISDTGTATEYYPIINSYEKLRNLTDYGTIRAGRFSTTGVTSSLSASPTPAAPIIPELDAVEEVSFDLLGSEIEAIKADYNLDSFGYLETADEATINAYTGRIFGDMRQAYKTTQPLPKNTYNNIIYRAVILSDIPLITPEQKGEMIHLANTIYAARLAAYPDVSLRDTVFRIAGFSGTPDGTATPYNQAVVDYIFRKNGESSIEGLNLNRCVADIIDFARVSHFVNDFGLPGTTISNVDAQTNFISSIAEMRQMATDFRQRAKYEESLIDEQSET